MFFFLVVEPSSESVCSIGCRLSPCIVLESERFSVLFCGSCFLTSVPLLLDLVATGNAKFCLTDEVAFIDSTSGSGMFFFFRRFIRGGDILTVLAVFDLETSEKSSGCAQLRARRGETEVDRLNAIELEPTSATGNTSSSSSGDGHLALEVDSLLSALTGRTADGSGGPVSVLDFRSRPFPVPHTSTSVVTAVAG